MRISSLTFLFLTSASTTLIHSENNARFENQDEKIAEAIAHTHPVAQSEYAATASVLISSNLIIASNAKDSFGKVAFARSILESGVNLTVLTSNQDATTIEAPQFEALKKATVGYHDRIRFLQSKGAAPTVWARDWAPIQALSRDQESILLDFKYYPKRPNDDLSPTVLATAGLASKRLSVPVYNEGGNFTSNSRGLCLMSDRVIEANSNTLKKPQIIDYYRRYVGCKTVLILPRMPAESTGHIDMVLKFLDDTTLLVNEISPDQLKNISNPHEKSLAEELTRYLNGIATQFDRLQLKVVRIPMPIPQLRMDPRDPEDISFLFRSYTNSLLIHANGKKTALIPRYRHALVGNWASSTYSSGSKDQLKPDSAIINRIEAYTDAAELTGYEKKVAKAYHNAFMGEIVWIDSDDLIARGGAVHCTTMQFAKPL